MYKIYIKKPLGDEIICYVKSIDDANLFLEALGKKYNCEKFYVVYDQELAEKTWR